MLIAIIGENCVGKSTLANKINVKINAKIYSGKDYLRLEKNPSMALEKFKALLKESVTGNNIIYLITEKEQIIVEYIKKYNFIRRSTVEDILDVKKTRVYKILTKLCEDGIIKSVGTGPSSKYIIK